MNLGLGNLDTLKKHLLGKSVQADTRFDGIIADIGRGVAAQFENYCSRKFGRATSEVEIQPADRATFLLRRYPLESLTSIHIQFSLADGWEAQTVNDLVQNISYEAGVVYLRGSADAGEARAQIKFTYQGGYFFETLEPDDASYPTATPSGSFALPDDLKHAWLLQCRRIWDGIDKTGLSLVDKPETQTVPNLDLTDGVKAILDDYRRMDLL